MPPPGVNRISLEWRRIYEMSFGNGGELYFPNAAIALWRELWEAYIEQMPLIALDLWDAHKLCVLGYEIALQQRDYNTAAERLELWLQHPAARFIDRDPLFHCRAHIATARLCAGRTAESVAFYRQELENRSRQHLTNALTFLVAELTRFLETRPPDEIAPAEVAALLRDIVGMYRKRKPLSDAIGPGHASCGALWEIAHANFYYDKRAFTAFPPVRR